MTSLILNSQQEGMETLQPGRSSACKFCFFPQIWGKGALLVFHYQILKIIRQSVPQNTYCITSCIENAQNEDSAHFRVLNI